jgi:hypothetical protein
MASSRLVSAPLLDGSSRCRWRDGRHSLESLLRQAIASIVRHTSPFCQVVLLTNARGRHAGQEGCVTRIGLPSLRPE